MNEEVAEVEEVDAAVPSAGAEAVGEVDRLEVEVAEEEEHVEALLVEEEVEEEVEDVEDVEDVEGREEE